MLRTIPPRSPRLRRGRHQEGIRAPCQPLLLGALSLLRLPLSTALPPRPADAAPAAKRPCRRAPEVEVEVRPPTATRGQELPRPFDFTALACPPHLLRPSTRDQHRAAAARVPRRRVGRSLLGPSSRLRRPLRPQPPPPPTTGGLDEAWIRFGPESDPVRRPSARDVRQVGKLPSSSARTTATGGATGCFHRLQRFEDLASSSASTSAATPTSRAATRAATRCSSATPTRSPATTAHRRTSPCRRTRRCSAASRSSTTPRSRTSARAATRRPAPAWAYATRAPTAAAASTCSPSATSAASPSASSSRARATAATSTCGEPLRSLPQVSGDEKKEPAPTSGSTSAACRSRQYVDQEIAGLDRIGYEGEIAWRIELPLFASLAGQQLFPSIAPSMRYSKLEPDFANPAQTRCPAWRGNGRRPTPACASASCRHRPHRRALPQPLPHPRGWRTATSC